MKKLQRSVVRFKGITVGLDLHKKMIQYSVMNASGDETANEEMAADASSLHRLLDEVTKDGHAVQVVLEASGCFVWAYDLLAKRLGKEHVHVAAPSKVRVIAEAGEKTDATDAWWLAYLQYEGRLPHAFVAEGDLRELRIACREHRSVVDERSELVCRLRSHAAQLGVTIGKSDFKSVAGRARVSALVEQVKKDDGLRGTAMSRLWTRIQDLDDEAQYWIEQRSLLAAKFEEVKLLDEELAGVGEQLASIVYSELGDPRRYKSAKAYAKATGLTPGFRESGGKRSGLPITRQGSAPGGHVRWVLTRAIVSCLRCKQGAGVWIKTWVLKMRKRKSTKAAIVAAARKLAESVWRLFALGEAFDLARAFGGPRRGAPPAGTAR